MNRAESGCAFDFNPSAGGPSDRIGFFDPNPDPPNPGILQTGRRYFFGEGFHQMQMPCLDNGANPMCHLFVADHIGQIVAQVIDGVANGEIKIDSHRLPKLLFFGQNANAGLQHQIVNEDMTQTSFRDRQRKPVREKHDTLSKYEIKSPSKTDDANLLGQ